jgi:acetyl esterase/lipase
MRTLRLSLAGMVTLALLAGLSGAVAAQEAEPAPATSVTRNLSYTADESRQLDVYTPSDPGPWPVVVIIPGASQSRSAYVHLAEAIAFEGAVVYNVGVSMYEPFPEATREVACAVRFARTTAADHGGDASRVTLVGHSAGAALGMVVAMAGDDYARDCVVTDGSALVDALVGYEGPFDWATTDYDVVNLVPLRDDDPEAWRAIDPYTHIGGNPDLVVRLVHGDDADVAWYEVPRAVSVEFDQALLEAGYDAELTLLEDAHHGAILDPEAEAADVIVRQALMPTD